MYKIDIQNLCMCMHMFYKGVHTIDYLRQVEWRGEALPLKHACIAFSLAITGIDYFYNLKTTKFGMPG